MCFYHPAVWWMSREVRRQREQCCDDIAVGVCDCLTYVSALSALASIAPPRLALAATGGSLRDRVRRLVEPAPHSSAKGGWMAMLPMLLVVSFVAPQAWGVQVVPPVPPPPAIVIEQAQAVPVTVPSAPVQVTRRPSVRVAPSIVVARRSVDVVVRGLADMSRRAQLASLELRLRQEEMQVARQKELVEKGLSTRDAAAVAELQVDQTRVEIEALRKLHVLNVRDVVVRKELSALDPDAIVQAQDHVTIAVAGEPDLPTGFTVSDDGAIRFPFLGSIRVQGSTARQVQSVIQKLIADKKLAQNASVTVSVRRARGR